MRPLIALFQTFTTVLVAKQVDAVVAVDEVVRLPAILDFSPHLRRIENSSGLCLASRQSNKTANGDDSDAVDRDSKS